MKKLKQLIIVGATAIILLSSSVTFANTTTDKLELMFNQIRNNPEFQDGQLFINAKFVTKSGLILQWDSQTGSFIFSDRSEKGVVMPPATVPTPIVNPTLPENPIVIDNNGVTQTTYNKLNAIIVDGETYFSDRDYSEFITWSKPRIGKMSYDNKTNSITINIYNKNTVTIPIKETIKYKNDNYIPIKYYVGY